MRALLESAFDPEMCVALHGDPGRQTSPEAFALRERIRRLPGQFARSGVANRHQYRLTLQASCVPPAQRCFFTGQTPRICRHRVGEQTKSDQLVETQSRDYASQLKKFTLRASNRSERSFS